MTSKSKADIIAERQANLPVPDDLPDKAGSKSLDESINVHPGENLPTPSNNPKDQSTTTGLDEPASKGSGVRQVERIWIKLEGSRISLGIKGRNHVSRRG
jgi:hypothetical protein